MINKMGILVITLMLILIGYGCSGSRDNPVVAPNQPVLTGTASSSDQSNTYLLGYYDIYFDPETQEFESVENRTADFTLNIVPFLNQMALPKNGISFDSIVVHSDDPAFLGVDVNFTIYHPFPGYDQYQAYDMRGVVIGDGSELLNYSGLNASKHGTDLWMKNPDGYTRWFNPTDFTTDKIFGYTPGGWQNYKGNAQLNPYKYYSKHLVADGDLWSYLTIDNNFDGIFESGASRRMELEFPLPPDGVGLKFGYAVVVAWEDQGPTGPFSPYHGPEAVAATATQTPDVWFDGTNSGGNLILDIDLFSWDTQPTSIKIDSSVLDGVASFDPALVGSPVSDNVWNYHVEAPAGTLTSTEGHEYWVIAEYEGEDYSNGLPDIPHADGPLAAFFRYDCEVLPSAPECPIPVPTAITGSPALKDQIVTETITSTNLFGTTGIAVYLDMDGAIDGTYDITGTGIQNIDVPTGTFDATFDLNGAAIGDYYVVVTNACGETGASDSPLFTIEESCPIPVPTEITGSPNEPYQIITETVTSTNLMGDTGLEVYLDKDGAIDGDYDIAGFGITNVNVGAGTFDASFDLTGAALGWYYVIVTNACGETGVSDEKLYGIVEFLDGDFYVSNHPDFNGLPEEGTLAHPYHTISAALDAATADGTDIDLILVDYGTGVYPEVLYNTTGNFNLRAYNWYSASGRPSIGGLDTVITNWQNYGTITFGGCANVTMQGFKLLFVSNNLGTTYYDIYNQYGGSNVTIKDCWFSGDTPEGATYCAAVTIYYVNGTSIENCLFKGINMPHPGADMSGTRIYAIDFQVQTNISIVRNEFTQFQWTGPSDGRDVDLHTGYEGGTYGNFEVNNNLYHHIWPTSTDANSFTFTGENFWDYYSDYNDPDHPFEVAFNTYDNINGNVASSSGAMGIMNYGYGNTLMKIHSNILTNFGNNGSTGIADYENLADYNDLWNGPTWGGGEGTGNISENPMYVNNSSGPYDYHLQTGSPCIGTGMDGEDMGCYGGLGAGEVIGLLTPED